MNVTKRKLVFYLVLSLCLGVSFACMPSWKVFQPDDDNFTVLMPGTPEPRTETIETSMGSIVLKSANIALGEKSAWEPLVFFSVAYGKLPNVGEWGKKEVIYAVKSRVLDSLDGSLVSETEISSHEYPGIEIVVELKNGLARVRCYIGNDMLYRLIVGGERQEVLSEDVGDRFLDSFQPIT